MSATLPLCRVLFLMLLLASAAGCGGQTSEEGQASQKPFSPLRLLFDVLSWIRPTQPDTVKTMEEHAARFAAQKRDNLAEQHYRLALTIRESAWGKEHANVLPGMDKLIDFYTSRQRYPAAASLAQEALALHERLLGADHPDLIPRLEAYATLLRQMQRPADAQALDVRVETIRRQKS